MPPLETLLGATELWRPAARGGGWATAAALLLLLASHLSLLLVRRYRRGRLIQPETAASTPAPSAAASGSSTGIGGLVTEDDLSHLVSSLGLSAREPELEGWEPVIAMGNDTVSYKAWCERTKDGPPKYLSVTTYEGCSTELLRDFYMDNEYRMEWDNTVTKHEQLQYDENSGIEIGRTLKKFPILTPREYILAWRVWESNDNSFYCLVKFPQALQTNMDESQRSPAITAAAVVPSTNSSGTSPYKQLGKKPTRETIASGLLLIGSIVCLSKGRSNLGAQLAMAFFLKKTFKKDKGSGSPRGRTDATV